MLSQEDMAHLKLGLWQMLIDAQEYARLRNVIPVEERLAGAENDEPAVDGEMPRRIFPSTEIFGSHPVKRQQGKRLKCYFNPVSCF